MESQKSYAPRQRCGHDANTQHGSVISTHDQHMGTELRVKGYVPVDSRCTSSLLAQFVTHISHCNVAVGQWSNIWVGNFARGILGLSISRCAMCTFIKARHPHMEIVCHVHRHGTLAMQHRCTDVWCMFRQHLNPLSSSSASATSPGLKMSIPAA